jgi:hypothetical protein
MSASGRAIPREFPPYTTVQRYFSARRGGGVSERINFELLLQARENGRARAQPFGWRYR